MHLVCHSICTRQHYSLCVHLSSTGGSHTGVYQFIHDKGYIPFDTCQPYLACSSNSEEGFCAHVDTTCTDINTCRTCSGFNAKGGQCSAISVFPHATIAEYGVIGEYHEPIDEADRVMKIKKEIKARGPVSASVQSKYSLHDWLGGRVFDDETASKHQNHVVSIVGWGRDENDTEYWICRNSWGEDWGEDGFFRVKTGANILGLEEHVAWATPGEYTVKNEPCTLDGKKCGSSDGQPRLVMEKYIDPSTKLQPSLLEK